MATITKSDIVRMAADPAIKLLGDDYEAKNIQGASYDLRIGTLFHDGNIVSVRDAASHDKSIRLGPSEIITMLTLEKVNVPLDMHATVFAINKNSSRGLLILNPGHIDPGYNGFISICAINLSKEVRYLLLHDEIFTISFHQLTSQTTPYPSKTDDRRSIEKTFLRNNSSRLSKSIFDSMAQNDNLPILKEMVDKIVKAYLYKAAAWFLGAVVVIGGIVKTVDTLRDSRTVDDVVNTATKDSKSKPATDTLGTHPPKDSLK